MNWTVFKSTLQLRRTSLFWYSFGIALYGWMMVAFFPLIEENAQYLETVQEVFTDEMLAIFGGSGLSMGTLGGFLGVEYLSLIWVFIVAAAAITFAAGSLAGAIENGSMEATLAQPVSRTQVVVSRWLAMAAYAAILNLVTVASVYLPGFIHDVDVPLDGMALLLGLGWLLTMAVGGLAYLLSALSSSSGRVIGISLGVLALMWLADILGNISEDVQWIRTLSLFHYWTPAEAIDEVSVAPENWIVFAIPMVLFFVLSVWAFRRRDVV